MKGRRKGGKRKVSERKQMELVRDESWTRRKVRRTLSLSDVISDGNASQLLERSDVKVRLLPLSLGSEGVLERLGLDDVRSLKTQKRGTGRGGEGARVSLGA